MADEEDKEEDAEEGEEDEDGEGGEKKGSKLKLILFILVPIVLIGGGGAAAYFTGALDSLLGVKAADGEHAEGEDGGHGGEGKGDGHGGAGVEGSFVAIPPMLVNLNTDDGMPRFLRLTVQLELENPDDHDAVIAVLPRVIDQFQTYLRELRVQDLRGSAGIHRLQIELIWRVNHAVEPIEIKDVLFQEILIQ
ncbi:MAG: flagellar basal body-associated FliL family protein [Alphaproteobacteria bacterium]|nr:flagellar basal body-associated FliL family protein [Alphaproteobacteria bacterium]